MNEGLKKSRACLCALLRVTSAAVVSLLILDTNSASARTCSDLFTSPESRQEIQNLGKIHWLRFQIRSHENRRVLVRTGVFESTSGSTKGLRLSFDYIRQVSKAASSPSAVLLHGVLNRRQDLSALSSQFENRGWNVLSVDLLGHGDTAFLNREALKKGEPIDHVSQIEIIASLTRQIHARLNLDRPIVVGHSLGGGLSMSLAKELNSRGLEPRANVPIAPYLSAIDKFMVHHGFTPDVLRYFNERLIEQIGFRSSEPGSTHAVYVEAWRNFFRVLFEPALIAMDSPQFRQLAEIFQSINDPYSKKFLEKAYRRYQELKADGTTSEAKLSEADLDVLIQGAIASTRGVRSLDYQARQGATPIDPKVPTLIVSGEKDPIVIRPQIEDFRAFAKQSGYDVTFVEMKGDHDIPQRLPVELTDVVLDFLADRGLLP